ncbi:hypothetical protein D3C76_1317300 [compost metagenome]
MLACPGCLHRRIQRQNVRLESNFVDNLDNPGDALGCGIDAVHRLQHLIHLLAAHRRVISGLLGQLAGQRSIIRV